MITPTPTPFSSDALRQRLDRSRPMIVRVGVGLLGGLFYIAMVFAGNGLAFALGVALFSLLGARELYSAVERKGHAPTKGLGYAACTIFQWVAWTHGGDRFAPYLPALLMLLVIATLLAELVKPSPRVVVNIGATILGGVYVGWLFSYLTLLRQMDAPILTIPLRGTTAGEWLVIFVTSATWLSDAGALFVGRAFGRHKMAPHISPGKTWEGAAGGLAVSLIFGAGFGTWLHLPMSHALPLALLCGFAGQVGDLCESALKRDLGIKDFGNVFAGHGGVLDRVDSLLFSAPLSYYFILFFLLKT